MIKLMIKWFVGMICNDWVHGEACTEMSKSATENAGSLQIKLILAHLKRGLKNIVQ